LYGGSAIRPDWVEEAVETQTPAAPRLAEPGLRVGRAPRLSTNRFGGAPGNSPLTLVAERAIARKVPTRGRFLWQ